MSTSPLPFNAKETAALCGSFIWAVTVSDYFKQVTASSTSNANGEAFIAFGFWTLFCWWLSNRFSTGWSLYVFIFALVTFAPFADAIDNVFGGSLGLSSPEKL